MFLLVTVTSLLLSSSVPLVSAAGRDLDPVVLTGADVPSLLGCVDCVTRLVAFSISAEGWTQAPLQVGTIALFQCSNSLFPVFQSPDPAIQYGLSDTAIQSRAILLCTSW